MREGKRASGVEVFNSVCEAMGGLGDSSVHLDQALSAGIRWTAFAVDDTHRLARDAFGGWIMVKARELTRGAILDAIRKGHFYATQAPAIRSLRVSGGTVHLACSPVRKIVWHAEGPHGLAIIAKRGSAAGRGSRSSASPAAPDICASKLWTPSAARPGAIPSGATRAPDAGATDPPARTLIHCSPRRHDGQDERDAHDGRPILIPRSARRTPHSALPSFSAHLDSRAARLLRCAGIEEVRLTRMTRCVRHRSPIARPSQEPSWRRQNSAW